MQKKSIIILQLALGLTVFIEAALLLFQPGAIRGFAKTGMPDSIRLILGWGELGGAALFLIP